MNKRDIVFKLGRSILLFSLCFAAIAFVLIVLEAVFHFPSGVRKYFFIGYVVSGSSALVIIGAQALIDFLNIGKHNRVTLYAKRIGEKIPQVKDKLLNAIQLSNDLRSREQAPLFQSIELSEESIRQVEEETRGVDFNSVISFRKNRQLSFFLIGSPTTRCIQRITWHSLHVRLRMTDLRFPRIQKNFPHPE